MKTTFVLCGPQGIGKTINSTQLADLLHCDHIIDDWDGRSDLRDGALAITNGDYVLPPGGVAFHAEDEAGLAALVKVLRVQNHGKPVTLFEHTYRRATARQADIAETAAKHGKSSPEYAEACTWAARVIYDVLPELLDAALTQSKDSSR